MPRLTMIEPPSSVAKQTTEVGDHSDRLSSSSQSAQSTTESKNLATVQHEKDADTATTAQSPETALTSTAKSQRSCGDGATTWQPPSTSGRKLKWNALVRKSKPLTLNSDEDIGAASTAAKDGTESRESETVEMKVSDVEHSGTADERHSASCQTSTMSSGTLRRESWASEHDCCSRKECHDCRSVVSSLSSLSSLSAGTSTSSLSSSARRKKRRLNAGCTATTKRGRCNDDDSYRSDRHQSRCCCSRPRHGCHRRRRCCCCNCRHERHYHCDDGRHTFEDGEQYGASAPSHRQTARQSAVDYPSICVTPPSYTYRTPLHQRVRGIYGLGQPFDGMPAIKQELSDDCCDVQRPLIVDGRSSHLPSNSTSRLFAHHESSSSILSDRSMLTSVESCPIPLEPVTGLSPSVDPRQLRQRQPAIGITTVRRKVDELDIIQTSTVNSGKPQGGKPEKVLTPQWPLSLGHLGYLLKTGKKIWV